MRAIDGEGGVRSFTFAEVARGAAEAAAALTREGVSRGDVVMTLMGARPEWVFALLGAWQLGAVALPCSEQLRRKDIALRVKLTQPRVVLTAGRNIDQLDGIADLPGVVNVDEQPFPGESVRRVPGRRHGRARARAHDLHLGHVRRAARGGPYAGLPGGQRTQAEHWLGARPGELVWCTAASGWSKSARNTFVAPWSWAHPAFCTTAVSTRRSGCSSAEQGVNVSASRRPSTA